MSVATRDDAAVSIISDRAVAPETRSLELFRAISRNDYDAIWSILRHSDVDPNEWIRGKKQTPLYVACKVYCDAKQNDHTGSEVGLAVIVLLLNQGADPSRFCFQNGQTSTALHLATIYDLPGLIRILMRNGNGKAKLMLPDVTPQNSQGNTPLHMACSLGKRRAVHEFLMCCRSIGRESFVAAMTARNNEGYTPVDIAVRSALSSRDRDLTIELLLKFWARHIVSQHGEHCLHAFLRQSKPLGKRQVGWISVSLTESGIGSLKTAHFHAVLKFLTDLCPRSVSTKDYYYGLVPFEVAAQLEHSVSTIYFLLRQCPQSLATL